jgi:CysZ protein
MVTEFVAGFRYPFAGFKLLSKPGVRLYVAIPLVINTLLFAAAIIYGAHQLGALVDIIEARVSGWWEWLEWLLWLLWPLFIAFSLVFIFFGFTLCANLLAAPFNGFLAAAVEQHLTGQQLESGGGLKELPKEFAAAITGELRKLGYFLPRAVALGLLFLVPLINILAPVLWLLFGAWMLALEYLDFALGNHGMTFPRQRAILSQRRFLGLGFGTAVLLVTALPIINFIAVPMAVAGATKLWVDELQGSGTGFLSS